jgi:hypothetical protein
MNETQVQLYGIYQRLILGPKTQVSQSERMGKHSMQTKESGGVYLNIRQNRLYDKNCSNRQKRTLYTDEDQLN